MNRSAVLGMPVSLVGHPLAGIGRGEDLRCCYRAFKTVGVNPTLVDVYGGGGDRELEVEFRADLAHETAGGVDIFCINGDEVEPVLSTLGARRVPARYSIVIPQWELSQYPAPWARQLERFDEVWAPSAFIRDTLAPVLANTVSHIPGSTGVRLGRFIGRRTFGIPESAYAFLFAFDLRSYQERKNPMAVVDAYAEVIRARPASEVVLVVKVAGRAARPDAAEALRQRLRERTANLGLGRVVVLERDLTDTETKNLVRCCDCFVSLHRSEGFGRFLAEAMLLGRPVIGTAYSGNMDFMTSDVSCLIDYRLTPVGPDEYPFWEGQVWADANVDKAVREMIRLLDDPAWGREIGARASRHIRTNFSYRAVGLQYVDRLRAACA